MKTELKKIQENYINSIAINTENKKTKKKSTKPKKNIDYEFDEVIY